MYSDIDYIVYCHGCYEDDHHAADDDHWGNEQPRWSRQADLLRWSGGTNHGSGTGVWGVLSGPCKVTQMDRKWWKIMENRWKMRENEGKWWKMDGKSMNIGNVLKFWKSMSDGKCSKHHFSNAKSQETHHGTTTQIVRNTECSRRKRGQHPTYAKSARHHISISLPERTLRLSKRLVSNQKRNSGDLSEHNMVVSYVITGWWCQIRVMSMKTGWWSQITHTFQGVETTNKT